MLTFGIFGAILRERSREGCWSQKRAWKKFLMKRKKFLTKQSCCVTITKLPPRKASAESTLKIEQCKNSLCKINTKKRVLWKSEMTSKFFWELESESIRFKHPKGCLDTIYWEFDPGSGWTLAACLTHASRTKHSGLRFVKGNYDLVADGWVMYEQPAFQRGTTVGNDC